MRKTSPACLTSDSIAVQVFGVLRYVGTSEGLVALVDCFQSDSSLILKYMMTKQLDDVHRRAWKAPVV